MVPAEADWYRADRNSVVFGHQENNLKIHKDLHV